MVLVWVTTFTPVSIVLIFPPPTGLTANKMEVQYTAALPVQAA